TGSYLEASTAGGASCERTGAGTTNTGPSTGSFISGLFCSIDGSAACTVPCGCDKGSSGAFSTFCSGAPSGLSINVKWLLVSEPIGSSLVCFLTLLAPVLLAVVLRGRAAVFVRRGFFTSSTS